MSPDADLPTSRDLSAAEVETAGIAIDSWLAGVREVLRYVERLPWLKRVDVTDEGPAPAPPAGEAAPTQQSHRHLVMRRFVQLYIESHLERRLKSLAHILTIESMSVQQDPHTDRLRDLLASIDKFRSKRLTGRIRAWLLKLSASFVLFVVGPAALLDGFDSEDVRRAFTAFVLLLSIPLYFLLLRPLTIRSGFVPKRALWSGGTTVKELNSEGAEVLRRWKDFPRNDLYRREATMFAALGASIEPERPLDISVGSDVAASVGMAGYVFGLLAWLWFEGASLTLALAAALVTGFVVFQVKGAAAHKRLRRSRLAAQRVLA